MHAKIRKLCNLIWTFKQPLTHKPAVQAAPVSDLFVWRCSSEWDTFLELVNLPALFEDDSQVVPHVAKLVFFDTAGHLFAEEDIVLIPNKRHTVRLSEVIGARQDQIGTFAVFHMATPEKIRSLGSFITERGYVSYQYRNTPLRAYVHGNLDAVALLPDEAVQMLGGYGLLNRSYSLQHLLEQYKHYECILVNPTAIKQNVRIKLMSFDNKILHIEEARLAPAACHAFTLPGNRQALAKLVVESQMVMARPVVFTMSNAIIDVFHG